MWHNELNVLIVIRIEWKIQYNTRAKWITGDIEISLKANTILCFATIWHTIIINTMKAFGSYDNYRFTTNNKIISNLFILIVIWK